MDKDQILDDELLDDEEEFEEGHDPMNAETKSVDSVRAAAAKGPRASKRRGDKDGGQKTAEKPNKGIVRELYSKMQEMTQEELRKLHDILMDENFDVNELEEDEDVLEDVTYDMSNDISDLVESEATLSEDFKTKAGTIMEMAVKTKVRAEVKRLEEAYAEQLEEELTEAKDEMVEKIDSYLNYVVENWMEENKLAIQNGLRTEIAENFMEKLKSLFEESYIAVPEEKVDLVDDLAEQVESLEAENNKLVDDAITMREELETYKREAIIFEMAEDLADTQADKLAKLAESLDFDDEETFRGRLATVKETYFGKKSKPAQSQIHEDVDAEDTDEVELSGNMAAYVNALKKRK